MLRTAPSQSFQKLRDLEDRQRYIAYGCFALILLPFALSAARAIVANWYPTTDRGLIALRANDVAALDFPLLGQPSTSHSYVEGLRVMHPGPIEFYWLAPFQKLFGPGTGMILGTGVVFLGSCWFTLWVVLRHFGLKALVVSTVLLSWLLASYGNSGLTDSLSSNAGHIPMLALIAGTAAVLSADFKLLPAAAVAGSWVIQQHLAVLGLGSAIALIALAGVAFWYRKVPEFTKSIRTATLQASVVTAFLWLPVIIDQFFKSGNVGKVVEYAGVSRESIGPGAALKALSNTLTLWPPLLVRRSIDGGDYLELSSPIFVVGTMLIFLGVLGFALLRHRTSVRPWAWAIASLSVCVAGMYSTTNIPESIEQYRLNFYRWTFAAVFGLLVALTAALIAPRKEGSAVGSAQTKGVGDVALRAFAAVAVLPLLLTLFSPNRKDHVEAGAVQAGLVDIRETASELTRDSEVVTLLGRGSSAYFAVVPMLALALEKEGHEVHTRHTELPFTMSDRRAPLAPGKEGTVLEILSVQTEAEVGDGDWETFSLLDEDVSAEEAAEAGGELWGSHRTIAVRVLDETEYENFYAKFTRPPLTAEQQAALANLTADQKKRLQDLSSAEKQALGAMTDEQGDILSGLSEEEIGRLKEFGRRLEQTRKSKQSGKGGG